MRVSESVQELERQLEAERQRAERAEGIIRVYEARDRGAEIAKSVTEDDKWQITWKRADDDEVTFSFAPGLWLLGIAQTFMQHPMPFELRVAPVPTPQSETSRGKGGDRG